MSEFEEHRKKAQERLERQEKLERLEHRLPHASHHTESHKAHSHHRKRRRSDLSYFLESDRNFYIFLFGIILCGILLAALTSLAVPTKEELQKVLDEFGSGVQIVRVKLQKADPPKQVVDAFNEVQRAKADMERFKNEAEAYRNEILPRARGEASQRLQNAQAYQEAVINKARGDADRFISVYNAYKEGKEVTIKRLYLETMEDVLGKSDKVILDPSSKGGNVLPYLPLNGLQKKNIAVDAKN